MSETAIEFLRYFTALLFGAATSFSFAGMDHTRKNYIAVGCFTVFFYILQVIYFFTFGMSMTMKIYPLLSHLPVILFSVIYFRRSILISVTCMFISFLCCQPPRWIGAVAGSILKSTSADHIGYIISAFFIYYILQKHVVKSARYMMERSVKSCLLFASMPGLYYFYGYIYDFLYNEKRAAALFMPFITAAFYFVFILLYYTEAQKQAEMQRERDMLDTQLKQAQIEFASLCQMQESAAAYRHDMRHHFNLLLGLVSEGRFNEAKEYLRTALSDMDSITPRRFCDNNTVNLILSAFATKAKKSEILFTIDVNLTDPIPLSDTELCSLLSNALENAINAAGDIADPDQRQIILRIYSKNMKLCFDIRNPYKTEPVFKNNLPVSGENGHGLGVKSMVHIVENHGGLCRFSIQNGWFIFQATANTSHIK